jgi:hypothetical protein
MFVGRLEEVLKLEGALLQTNAGQPVNFMLTGERGIGKTSLLGYCKELAKGNLDIDDCKVKFLVIETDIDVGTGQVGFVEKIELALRRELGKTEKARKFFSDSWAFIKRVETSILSVREKPKPENVELFLEEFSYSLADTVNRLCDETRNDDTFNTYYGGVLLLVDEADNASKELNLGTILKLLLERLQRQGCSKFMIGLAGLPDLRNKLYESHPSALRLFEEIPLERLNREDVFRIIDRCIEAANKTNPVPTSIEEGAKELLATLSEGYPHFVQQFGYCAFDSDEDNIIQEADVTRSAFGERGALEQIGDRYYRNDFYNKIKQESYRQVLRIMAEKVDSWVTKEEIRIKYHGNTTTLNNALCATGISSFQLKVKRGSTAYSIKDLHTGFACLRRRRRLF